MKNEFAEEEVLEIKQIRSWMKSRAIKEENAKVIQQQQQQQQQEQEKQKQKQAESIKEAAASPSSAIINYDQI